MSDVLVLSPTYDDRDGDYAPLEVIEKPWGKEEIIKLTDEEMIKRLTMHNGSRCSLQYHKKKKETIIVVSGTLKVYWKYNRGDELKCKELGPKQSIFLAPGVIHRMAAEDGDVVYLEYSTPHPDDVIRLEDDYARI